ncbi:hypothetical protein [Halosimplex sp. TS25]|uniref:hypothetical protein n=1 Tax=Halosimplex rarum TaxID=3396619 RepID=UPI0039E8BFF9
MERLGGKAKRGLGARLAKQTLRIAGLVTVVCTVAVTAASITTPHGLSVPSQSGTNAVTTTADVGTLTALVAFAAAHPAYPVVALLGFVLVVAGEETPLLG